MTTQPLLEEPHLHTISASIDSTPANHTNKDPTSSNANPSHLPPRRRDADTATIIKIEKTIESIVDGLLRNSDELSIPIKIKKSCAASKSLIESGSELMTEIRKVTFPGRTAHEAWRFSMWFLFGRGGLLVWLM